MCNRGGVEKRIEMRMIIEGGIKKRTETNIELEEKSEGEKGVEREGRWKTKEKEQQRIIQKKCNEG